MKKLLFLLIAICGVALTGCAQLIDMNEQESDVLAEYMAGTMLRYDKNYDKALIYPEQTTETTETADKMEPVETTGNSDTKNNTTDQKMDQTKPGSDSTDSAQTINIVNLDTIFNKALKNNFKIALKEPGFFDSYIDKNNLFSIEPSKGNKILAVSFHVKNITKMNKKLNLKDYDIVYKLTDNKDMVYMPMLTLLDNDIQYINLEVAAGKTQKAVILFDVPKDFKLTNMKLMISYNDKTAILDLNQ
ncbi:hypothetical protein QA584_11580 [Anaerocolumna sp. AGMB13025]|uniref:hypothetical protein n=1 Tax=Anaerocolumna sp. AGMB13025 TaxID=3039116 RepID=UPI00241C66DC|nr:hypothetical protein [Anaerocolumna sp. AGMB13025]WFR59694.1 hypothetical protein QA584_11580 [Anaerocolumna sp. AGMB13025]